jgi:hypothetical protein
MRNALLKDPVAHLFTMLWDWWSTREGTLIHRLSGILNICLSGWRHRPINPAFSSGLWLRWKQPGGSWHTEEDILACLTFSGYPQTGKN